ncbi:2,4'-dihydroxyacetophenone dioxygenase family protein [Candidimonas nitroreducens]|uniref:Cupin n=1 Tax=Candidimonas nitroreducens TaxID=683354 RepID=A0A225M887_9BURK|nr:2,4'-dihydroxyacetophenone dioxygenase family protein [Candidimonas nitroreducens]OWT57554.1 cupin [Candidimonas nitroreducens]
MLENLKPYTGPKSQHSLPELFVPNVLSQDDDRLWVPNGPNRWSRPLCLNVSQGYWVHLTKFKGKGFLSRHKHPAPVHAYVLKGTWRYLEREWVATPGSYLYETPGDIHTLVVDQEQDEMITMFQNHGAITYFDENNQIEKIIDVFHYVKLASEHFEKIGLGTDYVKKFLR